MSESGVWAESNEHAEENREPEEAEPAEVDESLETRRLRRWLRAMFGVRSPNNDEQR